MRTHIPALSGTGGPPSLAHARTCGPARPAAAAPPARLRTLAPARLRHPVGDHLRALDVRVLLRPVLDAGGEVEPPPLVEVDEQNVSAGMRAPLAQAGPADAAAVDAIAEVLATAERPLIYAGQGIHYAQAWDALHQLAELLEPTG